MKYRYTLDGDWSNETSLGNHINIVGEVQANTILELKQRMKEIVAERLRCVGGTTWEGLVTVIKVEETVIVDNHHYKVTIQTTTNVEVEL